MVSSDILILGIALTVLHFFILIKTKGLRKAFLQSKFIWHVFHLLRVSLPLFTFRNIILYAFIVRLILDFKSYGDLAITIVVSLATLSALCFTFTQSATGFVIHKDNDFFNRANIEYLKSAVFSSGIGFFQATIYFGIGFTIVYGVNSLPEFRADFEWLASTLSFVLGAMALVFLGIAAFFSIQALKTIFLAFDRELFDWPWPRPWWDNTDYTDSDLKRIAQKTVEKHGASAFEKDSDK